MTFSLPSTPVMTTAPTLETTRFVHKFGYHLAKQLLGSSTVNDCIKKAYESLQKIDAQKNQIHAFRANWRRPSTTFPWMLKNNDIWNIEGEISPESLFVDVTFDFLVFPYEMTEEGRTSFCHVVKNDEWEEGDHGKDKNQSHRLNAEERCLLSLSVAIRLGTLIAIPNDEDTISGDQKEKYQFYYQRGNPLTGPDICEHCRSIDTVPEEMDATQIADIIAKALSNDTGRVLLELKDYITTAPAAAITSRTIATTEDAKKQWYWKLELHYQELEGKGTLPLKTYNHNHASSKTYDDRNWGTPIDYSVLDTFLLNNQGQRCISLPSSEAKLVWDQFDPTLLKSLKEPVKPTPRCGIVESAELVTNLYAKKTSKSGEENKNDRNAISTKPKIMQKASPALFAKGKRTTIAGSKRKKPNFTIGPK